MKADIAFVIDSSASLTFLNWFIYKQFAIDMLNALPIGAETVSSWPTYIPANTRHQPNVGTMLAHRLRRWPNIAPRLGGCLVFAGMTPPYQKTQQGWPLTLLNTTIVVWACFISRWDVSYGERNVCLNTQDLEMFRLKLNQDA